MFRKIATWLGIGAVCLAIVFIPMWDGAMTVAQEAHSGWLTFSGGLGGGRENDKDCSDFAGKKQAQRFFIRHGGPYRDFDRLDRDGDGSACEGAFIGR